jgi:hypothetical protein
MSKHKCVYFGSWFQRLESTVLGSVDPGPMVNRMGPWWQELMELFTSQQIGSRERERRGWETGIIFEVTPPLTSFLLLDPLRVPQPLKIAPSAEDHTSAEDIS